MTRTLQYRQAVLQDQSGEAALHRLAALAAEFGAEQIASTACSIAERISEGRFYVACVGQFKRGKSTLLNALIGHSVLPTAVIPVTAVPTIIRYGERLTARVRSQSGAWTDIAVSSVEEYVSEGKNPENEKGVSGVEISVPSPLLDTGMCLVDTPGLGSVFAGNTAATQAFIPHIDAAIVVIGTDPPLSGDELQLVETISQDVHDLVCVLNKADRAGASERSAALEFSRNVLERQLKRTFPAIFEVSALDRLKQVGPERDWGKLVHALEDLVQHSGRSLVRKATDRGIRRAANQLLAVIKEERNALERPVEESERRIARLRETLGESETAMRDMEVLFTAEQQRLSGAFGERRHVFLKQAQVKSHAELTERLPSLARSHKGPAYRRNLNHLAQEIARTQLTPWLESEAAFAEQEFRKTAKRFVELVNEFLRRLGETEVPGLEELPEDLGSDQGLRFRSQFHFHIIERVAAPASPLLFIADLLRGGIGLRGGIVCDAQDFLDQLLEVNSSRVQSDVDERVRESRKKLEADMKGVLREASAIADRALARARAAQAAGVPGVQSALARVGRAEREVLEIIPSWPKAEPDETS
jgi:GTP-binding protein EngB required for normal cell division